MTVNLVSTFLLVVKKPMSTNAVTLKNYNYSNGASYKIIL